MGRSFDTGTTRWRRQLAMINADKVIVFFGAFYRIFNIAEMMIPTGVPIRTTPEDAQRVLDKFGFE
ncbi:MAG: hypothetical protein VB144_05080 [Clostridia bacterium]|nr:hypothetical protein [Clostridia bacterium]